MFQSRCRDWVVGEAVAGAAALALTERFSLVAEIGWLARPDKPCQEFRVRCFSLVAEIGWLAS